MFSKLGGWLGGGLLIAFVGVGLGSAQEPGNGSKEAFSTPAQSLYARIAPDVTARREMAREWPAAFLFPKPRDFRAGKYRLVSTENSVPAQTDLESMLIRGMPGSSMPSWAHLKPEERALLVQEVYRLTGEGARDRYVLDLKEGQGLTDEEIKSADIQEEIAAFVKDRTTPSESVAVPRIAPVDRAAIDRGKVLFVKQACASCHGNEGKGDGVKKMVDDEGYPTRSRDLTRGLYKGGHDPASLFLRVARGMPGTPMPSAPSLSEAQVVDLVHYLRSLSTEDQRLASILKREKIMARNVAALPGNSDENAWRTAPSARVRLAPAVVA